MKIIKFQAGGPMPAEPMPAEPMPAEGGGQDPMQMLVEGAMAALQNQDCEIALQVCQMLMELVGAAQGAAPMGEPAGEPVFRAGGKIVRRNR